MELPEIICLSMTPPPPASYFNRKSMKLRSQAVVVICRCFYRVSSHHLRRLPIYLPHILCHLLHISIMIWEPPECHMVCIDKHMPHWWSQRKRWVKTWALWFVRVSQVLWMDVALSLLPLLLSVSVWLLDHLLLHHLYTLSLSRTHSHPWKRGLVEGINQ